MKDILFRQDASMRYVSSLILGAWACACGAVGMPALTSETTEQLREEARRFDPAAAERALTDLARNPAYDAPRHRAAVAALAAKRDWAVTHLVVGDPHEPTAAALVKGYRAALLANPRLDFDRILCIRRHVANGVWPTDPPNHRGGSDYPYGRRALTRDMGLLGLNAHNHMDLRRHGFANEIAVVSNLRGGAPACATLFKRKDSSIVRDLDLDFDCSRILFTSAVGTNNLLAVYETAAVPGSPERRLSPADAHNDIQWWDGCYLPNRDQVILLGTAAYQFLPCEDGNFPMCVLYRLDRRTGETIQLTFEQDSDYTPSVLNDGRVAYTRWEYSDLQHYFSRELMTMNPDGTGQLALWGSGTYFPTFFAWAQAIPGDPHRLVMMGGGHHGRAEHGRMLLVDPTLARGYPFKADPPGRTWGPDLHPLRIPAKTLPASETGLVHEFPGYGQDVEGDVCDLQVDNQFARGKPYFAHPRALGGAYFLASAKTTPEGRFGLYLVDTFDNMILLAEAPDGALFEPIPFTPRTRPPVLHDKRVKGATTCTVHIADLYEGPGLKGVPRGTVRKLRVFAYHFCYHRTGGHVSTGLDRAEAGWDVKRVLGTVDVEEDGSVCFEMPANTPVSFQPLDADGAALQLMRSWTVGMPGERISCAGCHEDNRASLATKRVLADKKPIQRLVPPDGDGLRPWGFANELHPHLVASCARCHASDATDAAAAYRRIHPFVRRPGAESELAMLNPLEYHASTSPLVQMLRRGHHGARLSEAGWRQLYTWIDLNAPFRGKWEPKGFATDSYLPGCTNQIARRATLAATFGGTPGDYEAEYEAYAAKVAARGPLPPVPPVPVPAVSTGVCAQVLAQSPEGYPWPMDELTAAAAQSGRIDERARTTVKTLVLGGGVSMTFRRIPARKSFWLGEAEVENRQYHVFDPAHDSRHQDQYGFDQVMPGHVGNHPRQPVVRVSHDEAAAFCAWLSRTCGVRARLPTADEWEWAARAGTATPFPWGGVADDFGPWANLADRACRWMYSTWNEAASVQVRHAYPPHLNYPLHEEKWTDDWFTLNYTQRAKPNRWGLFDMHGNAAEWTARAADGRAYACGGSFASRPKDATSSARIPYAPWQKVFDTGFRVCLDE